MTEQKFISGILKFIRKIQMKRDFKYYLYIPFDDTDIDKELMCYALEHSFLDDYRIGWFFNEAFDEKYGGLVNI